jgi:hypothetical protein
MPKATLPGIGGKRSSVVIIFKLLDHSRSKSFLERLAETNLAMCIWFAELVKQALTMQ